MATTEALCVKDIKQVKDVLLRFYQPELDALRFTAFVAVFICHSVPNTVESEAIRGDVTLRILADVKAMGNFGVCLFFLLSAFLITELLRREYHKFSFIRIKAFYLRRILRIWPLYFCITVIYAFGGHFFPALHLEPKRIAAYFLLAGNWYIFLHPWIKTPLRALWSISVEEQFYLVWPWAMKFRTDRWLVAICIVFILASICTVYITSVNQQYAYITVWVNSLVQFQFFAWGALLAITARGRVPKIQNWQRAGMAVAGIFFWWVAAAIEQIKHPGPHPPFQYCFGYLWVAIGCILIFLAFWGINSHKIPSCSVYLGKISFGLYVFHETAFLLTDELQKHIENSSVSALWISDHLYPVLLLNKAIAFTLTVGLAALSYRFWESPFLRFKQKLTLIESRSI